MLTINRQLYGFYYFMFPYYSYYGWYYYSNPDSPPLPHRQIQPPARPQPENELRRRNQNRLQCTILSKHKSENRITLQTKNVTRINQDDPFMAAIEISQEVWPATNQKNRPNTVLVGINRDWQVNLPAVRLIHHPNNGPLLYAKRNQISKETLNEIHRLNPKGNPMNKGIQIILIRDFDSTIRNQLEREGWKVDVIKNHDPAIMAKLLDDYQAKLHGDKFSKNIIIGSMDFPDFTLPAANWIAHMPTTLLYVTKNSIPRATKEALQQRKNKVNIYALGPEKVISKQVKDQLKSYGKVTQISGNTPETNSIAFAKYKDQTTQFGWGITQPGHGLAFNRLNKVDSAIPSAAE